MSHRGWNSEFQSSKIDNCETRYRDPCSCCRKPNGCCHRDRLPNCDNDCPGFCHCDYEEAWNDVPPRPNREWMCNFFELRRQWSDRGRRENCRCCNCKPQGATCQPCLPVNKYGSNATLLSSDCKSCREFVEECSKHRRGSRGATRKCSMGPNSSCKQMTARCCCRTCSPPSSPPRRYGVQGASPSRARPFPSIDERPESDVDKNSIEPVVDARNPKISEESFRELTNTTTAEIVRQTFVPGPIAIFSFLLLIVFVVTGTSCIIIYHRYSLRRKICSFRRCR